MARKYHITQIVIGESQHSPLENNTRGSLTQKLVRLLVTLICISSQLKRDAVPSRQFIPMTRVIWFNHGTFGLIDAALVDIVWY